MTPSVCSGVLPARPCAGFCLTRPSIGAGQSTRNSPLTQRAALGTTGSSHGAGSTLRIPPRRFIERRGPKNAAPLRPATEPLGGWLRSTVRPPPLAVLPRHGLIRSVQMRRWNYGNVLSLRPGNG
jgi:hypothetical protein